MVCIPEGARAPELSPLNSSPRDWSHTWDKAEPLRKGEAGFVVVLMGVRKKARWRPRSLDSMPPIVHHLGACPMNWTRDKRAAMRDVEQFNRNQIQTGKPVTIWGAVGWGVRGFDATVRILDANGGDRR